MRVIFEEAGVQFEEINDLGVLVPMFKESKVTMSVARGAILS